MKHKQLAGMDETSLCHFNFYFSCALPCNPYKELVVNQYIVGVNKMHLLQIFPKLTNAVFCPSGERINSVAKAINRRAEGRGFDSWGGPILRVLK